MTLDELLATYNALRRDLTDYDAEYGPILQHRTALAQEVQEAQDRLTEAMYASGIPFVEDGDFEVSLVCSDRGFYDVQRLPKTRAVMEACDITISSAAVKKLVKRGLLTDEQAAAAFESKPAKPYVRVSVKTAVTR